MNLMLIPEVRNEAFACTSDLTVIQLKISPSVKIHEASYRCVSEELISVKKELTDVKVCIRVWAKKNKLK